MTDYQPTDEQLLVLGIDASMASDTTPRSAYYAQMRRSIGLQAIIRAAQAEALRDARVTPRFSDSVPNDGVYEYTSTSDCDGSNRRYLRRKPQYHGDYHPWEPASEAAWAAAVEAWDV